MKRKKNNHTKVTIDIQKNEYIKQLEQYNFMMSDRATTFLSMIFMGPSGETIQKALVDNQELTPELLDTLKTVLIDQTLYVDQDMNNKLIGNFLFQVQQHLPELKKIMQDIQQTEKPVEPIIQVINK